MSAPQPSAIEERRAAPSRAPAALRDLDERREHRDPRRRDRHRRHADRLDPRERRGARRADRRPPRPRPRADRVPRGRAGRRQRRRAVHHRDRHVVVRERRDGREPRRRLQRRSRATSTASCVTVTPVAGQVRRRRRGGRGRLPEPRPRAAADRVAARLLHLARAGARGRRRLACRQTATSVGSSNIVLAMPAPLAESIGWDAEPPTWGDVFDSASDADLWSDLGHPEWGAFKLGKTSPMVATSGEAAMFASFGTAAGVARRPHRRRGRRPRGAGRPCASTSSPTSHYMATPEHFLWHARQADDKGSAADFLSAVIVDEKSVWDYNRGITSRDGVTRVEGDAARGAARPDLSRPTASTAPTTPPSC